MNIDVTKIVQDKFKEIFLRKTKGIKLSSIFEKFREIACKEVDEWDKYARIDEGWYCKCEVNSQYGWIDCELDYEKVAHRHRKDNKISFTVHLNHDKSIGKIYSVYFGGNDMKNGIKFGGLNDVEILLLKASMNKIPIIIDVDSTDDIDNSFDVDY